MPEGKGKDLIDALANSGTGADKLAVLNQAIEQSSHRRPTAAEVLQHAERSGVCEGTRQKIVRYIRTGRTG